MTERLANGLPLTFDPIEFGRIVWPDGGKRAWKA